MRFWKNEHVDERVLSIQNKIYKELYIGIILLASLSIVIKFFTVGVSLQVVFTEWLIILFSSVYYLMRSAYLGIYSEAVELHDSRSKVKLGTKYLVFGVAVGLIIAIGFGANSAINYADSRQEAVYFFFLVFGVSLFIYVPFFAGMVGLSHLAAKKKSDQMNQNQLDDHEGKW